ncbi:MAG: elongation factor G [Proteobacteria bacterium]|nr:elongation factor G [Pseudomonadota bacterium]MBI3496308.1 elongation factor G [Pseudomonadota bacterium]
MGDPARPRTAVLVGPYLSGKTTLLESLLFACEAIPKRGSVKDATSVGDGAPEARARKMSVEASAASATYLGDPWTFIDTPGSIELAQEVRNALMVADVAVVVCEPLIDRVQTLAPIMRFLDEQAIPHMLFINKMDQATVAPKPLLEALQGLSEHPLVLRQVPIYDGETLTGYVDLVSERAYRYRPGQPSDLIKLPETALDAEKSARTGLLEALADFDDGLLEALLEDTVPPPKEIYKQLTKDLQADKIVPVFLGAAEFENGVRRLLKALRHETPGPEAAAARRGLKGDGEAAAEVFKTYHAAHTGKLTLARVWRGSVKDGQTLSGTRVSGLYRMNGVAFAKLAEAKAGDVVAFGRMEGIHTGAALTPSGARPVGLQPFPPPLPPQFSLAITAENRNDEVKLSGAMAKLTEEDPALNFAHEHDTGELVLQGQGDIHLQIAMDRLKSKYNLKVRSRRPRVPYKETIRKGVAQHGRHKRQSGGHGQFGDIKVEIKPLPRGEGFVFIDKVVGGSIPRQYIPSVEEGVREFMVRGPLGFHLVDFSVTLLDGQYHAVDSSDMAFKTAARIAMSEGMPKCDPVLLEPIAHVTISVPNDHTSKVQRVITGRRGQILGFDAKPGWKGWDEVTAYMPQSEIHDLIIDIRSLTLGVASYIWKFDHLAELTGRLADKVIEDHAPKAAAAS